MMTVSTLTDLSAGYERLATTQHQMSTGKRIARSSDDPTLAGAAMTLRSSVSRYDSYDRSLSDSKGWLGAADGALTSALERLNRAKEITVRASNSGGLSDPSARQAFVAELTSIRDDLLGLANTSFEGRSVFAGTVAGPAYDATGTFLGNQSAVLRDVDPHTTVQVNTSAFAAFGDPAAAGGDIFAVISRLNTAITNKDDVALAAAHSDLDTAVTRLGSATVTVGARGAQMENVEIRNANERQRLQGLLSDTEDVDLAQVMVDLKSRENAYQAALQVASRVLPQSLVDFLR
jgi:flagellar hook-associated protein 3 FlgL